MQPPRWTLAVYVLAVVCLFAYTQLNPGRYLRLMGFKRKRRPRKGMALTRTGGADQTKDSGGSNSIRPPCSS
ncbi:MAG: hypothetical protein ACOWYE_00555 [Desulfatiglandales bacterium]